MEEGPTDPQHLPRAVLPEQPMHGEVQAQQLPAPQTAVTTAIAATTAVDTADHLQEEDTPEEGIQEEDLTQSVPEPTPGEEDVKFQTTIRQ